MNKPEWVAKLESEPCKCLRCSFCNGSGTIYFDISGDYIGSYQTDDLDNPEPCDECGNGIVETCDRCELLEQYEREP